MTLPEVPGTQTPSAPAAPVVATRLPRVNLMPPEIAEAAAFRRFQLAMGGAVVAALVVVGALYVHEHSTVGAAKQQLTSAQSDHSTLEARRAGLASVQDVYTRVAAKQAMLGEAMGAQITWSSYLADLSLKVPDGVWLTNVSASETAGAGVTPTAVSTTPGLLDPGIGTINFSGTAFNHDQVANWLDMLAKERGWSDPYFTNSAEAAIGTKPVVTFSSSAVIKPAAKSGRFAPKTGN